MLGRTAVVWNKDPGMAGQPKDGGRRLEAAHGRDGNYQAAATHCRETPQWVPQRQVVKEGMYRMDLPCQPTVSRRMMPV